VAPQVNVRQVNPRSYNKISDGKKSIADAIHEEGNMTFSTRKMIIYPFVICKQDGEHDEGVALFSVARGQSKCHHNTLKNISVIVHLHT
jgi:hypothetical protein